jgi:hypothetical protein
VGHRKDEHVLLVLFESDDIWKSVDDCLANYRARAARARPWRIGFRRTGNPIECRRNLADELVA